jgi:hypothetical protein
LPFPSQQKTKKLAQGFGVEERQADPRSIDLAGAALRAGANRGKNGRFAKVYKKCIKDW